MSKESMIPTTGHVHTNFVSKSPGLLQGIGGPKTRSVGLAGLTRAPQSSQPLVYRGTGDVTHVTKTGGGARVVDRLMVRHPAPPKSRPTQSSVVPTQSTETSRREPPVSSPSVETKPDPLRSLYQDITQLHEKAGRFLDDMARWQMHEDGGPTTIDDLLRKGEKPPERVELRSRGDGLIHALSKNIKEVEKQLAEVRILVDKEIGPKSDRQVDGEGVPPSPAQVLKRQLEDSLKQLHQMRHSAVQQLVALEFKGFAGVIDEPLRKTGAILSLSSIQGIGPVSNYPAILPKGYVEALSSAIDQFNEGATLVRMGDTTFSLAGLKEEIDFAVMRLAQVTDPRQRATAVEHLTKLSDAIGVKLALAEITDAAMSLLGKDKDFPISSALRNVALAFPIFGETGETASPDRLQAKALGIATLLNQVARGHDLPSLQGRDPKNDNAFDKKYLAIKKEAAGERAVEQAVAGAIEWADRHLDDNGKIKFTEVQISTAQKEIGQLSQREINTALAFAKEHGLSSFEEGHEKLREIYNLAVPRPTKEQLALANVPLEKISPTELTHLKEYALALGDIDGKVAYEKICAYAKECGRVREQGQQAAELRHELNKLNRNLTDILRANPRKLLKPTTWGSSPFLDSRSRVDGMIKGPELLEAIRKFAGKAVAKDIIVLYAHISNYQSKTLQAEQRLFGLHQGMDFKQEIDRNNPLAHLGISNRQLEKIGVSFEPDPTTGKRADPIALATGVIDQMANQGMRSFEQAHDTLGMINKISKKLLRCELVQDMTRHFEQENARALGHHLASQLVADVDLEYRREHKIPPGRDTPKIADDLVTEGIIKRVVDINEKIESRPGEIIEESDGEKTVFSLKRQLELGANSYEKAQFIVVEGHRDHLDVEQRETETRQRLEQLSRKLGMDVDPNDPRGLRSAKVLVEVLEAWDQYRKVPLASTKRRLDEGLEALRGFDVGAMRRPWHQKVKAAFGGGQKLDLKTFDYEQLRDLRQVAESIIFLREDAPLLRAQAIDKVERFSGILDELMVIRRQQSGGHTDRITDLVRLAVLNEWTTQRADFTISGGEVKEAYDPSAEPYRGKIEEMLRKWGVDLVMFRPEIEEVLSSRMTPDDMIAWGEEAKWSDETLKVRDAGDPGIFSREGMMAMYEELRHQFSWDGAMRRRAMDDETRQSLISLISTFQEGDKVDLKSGKKITLNTGKLPVDATGLFGLKAKLSGSHLHQMEIERGSDGIRLHLRSGLAGTGSLEALVGKKFKLGEGIEVGLEASAGLEIGGGKLTGVAIAFENSPKGLESLVNLVGLMIDGEKAKIGDLAGAFDIARSSETRKKISGNVQANAKADVGLKGPKLLGKQDKLGVGLAANAQAVIAGSTKSNVVKSGNEITHKDETEYLLTVNTNVNFFANVYNPVNMLTGTVATKSGAQKSADNTFGKDSSGSSNYDMTGNTQSTEEFGAGTSSSVMFTQKTKEVFENNGFLTKAERVRQSNIVQTKWQAFAIAGNDVEIILRKPENKAFAEDFRKLVELSSSSDIVQMTYALSKEDMRKYNDSLNLAKSSSSRKERRRHLAEAKEILKKGRYAPDKISLVRTSTQKIEYSEINAKFFDFSSFGEGKTERTYAWLKFPT